MSERAEHIQISPQQAAMAVSVLLFVGIYLAGLIMGIAEMARKGAAAMPPATTGTQAGLPQARAG